MLPIVRGICILDTISSGEDVAADDVLEWHFGKVVDAQNVVELVVVEGARKNQLRNNKFTPQCGKRYAF